MEWEQQSTLESTEDLQKMPEEEAKKEKIEEAVCAIEVRNPLGTLIQQEEDMESFY